MTFRYRLTVLTLAALVLPALAQAQFTDSGQVNTEYARTDPAILGWATSVADYSLGFQTYTDPGLGLVSYGAATDILGPNGTVFSLGDGGHVTVTFGLEIQDGPGDDFVVFENGFVYNGIYMELGFVEVSSDGATFSRLPALCRRDTQPGAWDPSDPALFYNLAGNFAGGTGFDLQDLLTANDPNVGAGLVDLAHIAFVRVVDVVGDITGPGGTVDYLNRPVADPFPTSGASSGMDVTGVAVLHTGAVATESVTLDSVKALYR